MVVRPESYTIMTICSDRQEIKEQESERANKLESNQKGLGFPSLFLFTYHYASFASRRSFLTP